MFTKNKSTKEEKIYETKNHRKEHYINRRD